jgi:hypothetical protein
MHECRVSQKVAMVEHGGASLDDEEGSGRKEELGMQKYRCYEIAYLCSKVAHSCWKLPIANVKLHTSIIVAYC